MKLPGLKRATKQNRTPTLSVLISSPEDIDVCRNAEVDIYFQLPGGFKNQKTQLIELFKQNSALTPWFPSILIGDDYLAALEFLEQLHPALIATNNTGVAYEAYKKRIPWIAGPSLNIANSYSLLCLKENFNCKGAFLTNEISCMQMKPIREPGGFSLYYTIYQPVELMSSRQCLFHQVTRCEKHAIDQSCLPQCEKTSTITNLKGERFLIEKSKGNYHRIFSAANMLNTDVFSEVPDCFTGFSIDLRHIKTETITTVGKTTLIALFKAHLSADARATQQLITHIRPAQNKQYESGL